MSAGIPRAVRELTVQFRYNDTESLIALFGEYPGQIACVVMEAATTTEPKQDFLGSVGKLCRAEGAVFILDEMITGFRWHLGGAQKYYGMAPDLSIFGKAMANGFSVSALAGKKEIMELGGLRHDKGVFLLSTTHGAENHSLAAAIETMKIYKQEQVVERLHRQREIAPRY